MLHLLIPTRILHGMRIMAHPLLTGGHYGVAHGTPFDLDPSLYGLSHPSQSPGEGDFGIDQISQMKGKVKFQPLRGSDVKTPLDAATAGPTRTERLCRRQAPYNYRVDSDHEGASTKIKLSQQAFQVPPGYENPERVQTRSQTER